MNPFSNKKMLFYLSLTIIFILGIDVFGSSEIKNSEESHNGLQSSHSQRYAEMKKLIGLVCSGKKDPNSIDKFTLKEYNVFLKKDINAACYILVDKIEEIYSLDPSSKTMLIEIIELYMENYLITGKKPKGGFNNYRLKKLFKYSIDHCQKKTAFSLSTKFACLDSAFIKRKKPVITSFSQFHLADNPEKINLTIKEQNILFPQCENAKEIEIQCQKAFDWINRKKMGTRSEITQKLMRELSCQVDTDCIPLHNGCALKKLVQNSTRTHARFKCVCKKGPTVTGCFPAK